MPKNEVILMAMKKLSFPQDVNFDSQNPAT